MRKSTLFVVAVIAAALALMVPGPAGAAEVSAKSTTRVDDARGDVPYCKGDLSSAKADWNAELRFELVTFCAFRRSDPEWTQGDSGYGFLIDTNGDNNPDFITITDSTDSGTLYNISGGVVCRGVSSTSSDGLLHSATFGADCLPGTFTFMGAIVYDENPNGSTCTCAEDDAPDAGFSAPVYRGAPPPPPPPPPAEGQGYWMLGRGGAVYAFGDAGYYGNSTSAFPRVDLEPTPSGRGYWILNDRGQITTHGDAPFLGGTSPLRAFEAATAVSRTPSGNGYWIFTNLGRVFSFGDAQFFGDMSGARLNGPVLDAIPTPTGMGYYMVGSDGGIFTFGDASFYGSMGGVTLNAPVQSLVPDLDGNGYWLVASDGGIFAFEAEFYGSMGNTRLNKPVTGMVGFGEGYLMVGEDGGIFTFGDAPFYGSLGDNPPTIPIVSTAVLNQ